MADKIVILRDGRVEQIGSPLELYDRPANGLVAGFIGSPAMNFLKGKIRSGAVPGFVMEGGAVLFCRASPGLPDPTAGRCSTGSGRSISRMADPVLPK